ncbi:MAG: VOC family protein [Pseudomonadota bacterium]
MLLYSTLGTDNLPRAVVFYDAVFKVLGHSRVDDPTEGWAGWGKDYDNGYGFWLCPPFDGMPSTSGNGTMFAFRADSAEQVRAFHAAGLANGGTDEGLSAVRDYYEPDFFVAYLRDPDGNKLAAVYHRYDPEADR